MYKFFFQLVFKRMDPEQAHYLAFRWIRLAARVPVLRTFLAAALAPRYEELRTEALGLRMHGPFGLAAGFDKNAVAIDGMAMLGFDHVEIGTVTGEPQPGNPKQRLFRLVADRALINRMGFNNEGSQVVARRLERLRSTPHGRRLVVGVNIGKTKVTPAEHAAIDYATSAGRLAAYADYLVVNVSSPNTPGLRDLQSVEALRPILEAVREAADEATTRAAVAPVPLLVKIAPDLSDEDVDAVADLAAELGLDGVVAVNTTIAHDLGPGGLSGPPVLARGLDVVARLRTRLGRDAVIIGVGGITTAADAREYLAVGATLVQGYTGFIYQGPAWAARIGRALAADARRTRAAVVR